jgi:hypothetical protein
MVHGDNRSEKRWSDKWRKRGRAQAPLRRM